MSVLMKTHLWDQHSGNGVIKTGAGNSVNAAGAPVQRRVALYDRDSMQLIRLAWSDTAGQVAFKNINEGRVYFAVAIDHTDRFNAARADNITPVAQS